MKLKHTLKKKQYDGGNSKLISFIFWLEFLKEIKRIESFKNKNFL